MGDLMANVGGARLVALAYLRSGAQGARTYALCDRQANKEHVIKPGGRTPCIAELAQVEGRSEISWA